MRYVAIAALLASLGLGGVAWWQYGRVQSLRAENASLARSLAAMQEQAKQSSLARQVEAQRAKRWQERAAELDASINALFTGDIPDAPLDPRIIAFLDSLQQGD